MKTAAPDDQPLPIFNRSYQERVWSKRRQLHARQQAVQNKAPAVDVVEDKAPERKVPVLPDDPTPFQIIAFVAAKNGFTREQLISKQHLKGVLSCRHEAILELRRLRPDLSFHRIAQLVNRNHSTVIYVLQKHGLIEPRRRKREAA
jgi:chromosomal replication initiation ATPase DnaA